MRIIQRGGRGIAGHRHHKLQLFGRYASGDVQIDHTRHALQPEVRSFDIAFIAGQLEHHFVAQPHRRFKRGVGFIMNFAVARDRRRAPEPVRIGRFSGKMARDTLIQVIAFDYGGTDHPTHDGNQGTGNNRTHRNSPACTAR